jgi:hypothetical protein
MINSFVQSKNINNTVYVIQDGTHKQFVVTITHQNVIVTKNDQSINEPVLTVHDFAGYWFSGNLFHSNDTLLIKISAYDYIHIGCTIYRFKISESMIGYVSPINNRNKHPILLAEYNAYMLGDIKYLKMKRYGLSSKHATELYDRFNSDTYEKEIIMIGKLSIE